MEFTPNISLLFLVVLLVCFNFHLPPAEGCHPDDQRALLQIKSALGNNASAFSTWVPQTDCCQNWSSVICKKLHKSQIHRVNFLEISGVDGIAGEIPPAVGDLPYLETLIFRLLPKLTGPIPPAIGKLTKLQLLFLNWDDLTGPIPHFLNRLTDLNLLWLNNNRLSGSIPGFLGRLPNLGGLVLNQNKLTGPIPAALGFLPPQAHLTLSDNRLTGPIPRSLGRVNFEILELSGNRLTGDASFLLSKDKSYLAHFDLSHNRLSFNSTNVVVPTDPLNSSLLVFNLNNNRIYGQLPVSLGQAQFMYQFNVSYNRLCGPIPTVGGELQQFDESSFSHNKCLCGSPLPPCKS